MINTFVKAQINSPRETSFNNTKTRRYFKESETTTDLNDQEFYLKHKKTSSIGKETSSIKSFSLEKEFTLKNCSNFPIHNENKIIKQKDNKNDKIYSEVQVNYFKIQSNKKRDWVEENNIDISKFSNIHEIIDSLVGLYYDYDMIIKGLDNIDGDETVKFIENILVLTKNLYSDRFFLSVKDDFLYFNFFIVAEIIVIGLVFTKDLDIQGIDLIKSCFYYLHLNLIILIFYLNLITENKIITSKLKRDTIKELINKNNTWLNKFIYKKLFFTNMTILYDLIVVLLKNLVERQNENDEIQLLMGNLLKEFQKEGYELKIDYNELREIIVRELLLEKTKTLEDYEAIQKPMEPYLPDVSKFNFTLILDLDETLVHFVDEGESSFFLIRPGAEKFLEELSHYYELVIFTAATQKYADYVLNELDKNNLITHRLYRQHTIFCKSGQTIKDISKLGRDIRKMIIIDNTKENFQLQIENGLHIKDFIDDPSDDDLIFLLPEMKALAAKNVNDVRTELKIIREKLQIKRKKEFEQNYESFENQ